MKKYKWWFKVLVAIDAIIFADVLVFSFVGVHFLHSTSETVGARFCVGLICTFIIAVSLIEKFAYTLEKAK